MFCGLLPTFAFGYQSNIRIRAAEVKASFINTSYDDEPEANYQPDNGVFDVLKARFGGHYGKYHRASNRWHGRLKLLRELREELRFESAEIRQVRDKTNEAWVGINARKIITKYVDNGALERRHSSWFRAALVEVFFMKDDDDEFMSQLRTSYVKSY